LDLSQTDPAVLLGIIVVGSLFLIGAIAGGIATAVFVLDREKKFVPELEAKQAQKLATAGAYRSDTLLPGPSLLSLMVAEESYIEVPPSMGIDHGKLGMWAFLASEIVFFSALIGGFIYYRFNPTNPAVPPEGLNVILAGIGTFILIVSSLAVVLSLDALWEGNQQRFQFWLIGAMLFGATFITIQGFEWSELLEHGTTPTSDLFGTAFFVLTGFHGTHVIVGLLWLVFALLRAFRGDFTPKKFMGIETFGLYWHFVDVVWIVLFTLIYLI
jgi:heme/copper-type cytochrome/quinol oxidase subunit 3